MSGATLLSEAGALAPEIWLLLGGFVTLVGGSFTPRLRQWRMRAVAAVAVAGSLGFAVIGLLDTPRRLFEGSFTVDHVTGVARVLVDVSVLLLLAMAGDEVSGHPRESETCALLLFSATGALLLSGATDLSLLIVGFLLSSIPLYALIGLFERPSSPEAALKTYLLGALFGVFLMLGVTVLFGITGSTLYSRLATAVPAAPGAAVSAGVVLVLSGLLFKAGAVPAHFWVPDAAEASSATTAAFLTTVPKIGGLVAIARLLSVLPDEVEWSVLIGVIAGLSMTLGNLAAYFQDDPRRLLGWSTVSQVGYLLVPVAVVGDSALAVPSLLFYLAGYAITNIGAFAVAEAEPELRTLSAWTGVGGRRPLLAGALVVLLLGLVGTPPTAVFVGKLTTASAAWDGHLAWLAALVLLNSVLSLFYYLRWLAPVFDALRPKTVHAAAARQRPASGAVARRWPLATAYVAAAASVLLGVLAGPVWAFVSAGGLS